MIFPEAALPPFHPLQHFAGKQVLEETLNPVRRSVVVRAPLPGENVERLPIGDSEPFQCLQRLAFRAIASALHRAPHRGGKQRVALRRKRIAVGTVGHGSE